MFARKTLIGLILPLALILASCRQETEQTVVPTVQETATLTRPAATASPAIIAAATLAPSKTPPATVEAAQDPPDLRYLQAAIEETVAEFDNFSSYVVVDLQTGQSVARNEDVAIAGMSLVKVPILINTYRVLDGSPDSEQTKLITETTALSSNFAANLLLQSIAGKPDAYAGADIVSQSMRDLGIYNTFIAVPIDADPRPDRLNTVLTPANQRTDITTYADPFRQTTTGDLAQLFQMIYACAEMDSGPLREKYPDQISAGECRELLDFMQLNELARLLENGLPQDTLFAHKVGWIDDTHGDGGIVFSSGGDYIIVMALYAPSWLEWDDSAPLFEAISRQVYAHFNDPEIYAGVQLPPVPTPFPVTATPDLPHAIVTNTQGIGLTVRDIPGGAEVAILPDGTVLTLLQIEPVEHNGYRWHQVRTPDGNIGWAADAYFTIWGN
jgi:beta-lactamase class A